MARRGYYNSTVERINSIDTDNPGVKLGRLCVLHGYTAEEVSEVFNISRMTVYNWFTGRHKPSRHLRDKIQSLITRLEAKPVPEQNPTTVEVKSQNENE